ncbi:hypothetical protein N0V82_001858 [Gnomoniopsis sp. IMI 355080]|nr:hypothetical protein N0V82_001858 [Gnomoniopsis sp. IMI 355080]
MTDRYGHPRQSIFNRRHASAAASVAYSTSQHPPPPAQQPPAQTRPIAQPLNAPSRALFRSQLTRRPPPKHGLAGGVDADGDTVVADEEDQDVDGIVVRNLNGDFELEEPPSLVVDDPEEIVLDMRQENESEYCTRCMWSEREADLFIAEERQRLADAVKQHQSQQNRVPAQPEAAKMKLQSFLRLLGQVYEQKSQHWRKILGCMNLRKRNRV